VTWIEGDAFLVASVVKILVIFTLLMVLVALWTWVERRVCGFIQNRTGPNRVGPFGILQPAADGLKNFLKEETFPPFANRPLFLLAPLMAFIPALITFSIIPVAAPLPTKWGLVGTQIADLPVGFLFILAVTSIGVYGVALAGWSSNNKYALLGGLRASAQMISYEIAMGMSSVALLVLSGNITLNAIVAQQQAGTWFIIPLFLAFFLFLVASFAETNRLPFDLPEAEAELVAGYHTEYSAMKFSMFYIAEYSNMITASGLITTLFLGGWDIPFTQWDNTPPFTVLKFALTFGAFWAKTLFFLFLYIWVRWTLPRFRFDQLMDLGWKVLLPAALIYVMLIATLVAVLDSSHVLPGVGYMWVLGGVNVVAAIVFFWVLDKRRLVTGAGGGRARRVWHAEAERAIEAEHAAAAGHANGGR